jgi:hypothetical protein
MVAAAFTVINWKIVPHQGPTQARRTVGIVESCPESGIDLHVDEFTAVELQGFKAVS